MSPLRRVIASFRWPFSFSRPVSIFRFNSGLFGNMRRPFDERITPTQEFLNRTSHLTRGQINELLRQRNNLNRFFRTSFFWWNWLKG